APTASPTTANTLVANQTVARNPLSLTETKQALYSEVSSTFGLIGATSIAQTIGDVLSSLGIVRIWPPIILGQLQITDTGSTQRCGDAPGSSCVFTVRGAVTVGTSDGP